MVLENNDILEIIQKPANQNITEWRKQNEALCLFYEGGDVAKFLETIKNYENYDQKILRDKIAKSTKDLMSYLLSPMNKVFSASGFNREFDIGSDAIEKDFKKYIDELPQGVSILKWMEIYWKRAYICDPNGIVFIEQDVTEEANPYPAYKSIQKIRAFKKTWESYEYIVFEPIKIQINGDKKDCFRIVDDEKDAFFYDQNNMANLVNQEGFEPIFHQRDYVPAVTSSDIIDVKTSGYLSFVSVISESLREYMSDSSIHSIYKFLHGYPIFWSYAMECVTCSGTGKVVKRDHANATPIEKVTCPTCNGKRIKVTKDVSDGVRLPLPKSDQTKVAPDVAGYVQPAIETWQKQLDELHNNKKEMHFSIWGTYTSEDEKHDTALGRYIDGQPVDEKLNSISDTGQKKESQILSFMAKMMHGVDEEKSVKSFWGRRFMVETTDQLWEKYLSAKEKKAPISSLNDIYKEYLNSKFRNDETMLELHLKMLKLEPLPHFSLNDLKGTATTEMIAKKLLFQEWVNFEADFDKELNVLKKEYETYFNNNYIAEQDEIDAEV